AAYPKASTASESSTRSRCGRLTPQSREACRRRSTRCAATCFPLGNERESRAILREEKAGDKLLVVLRSTESGRFSLQRDRLPDRRARGLPRRADRSAKPPREALPARTAAGRGRRSRRPAAPSV